MYKTFFQKQFSFLRSLATNEAKDEIINYMIKEFTFHVLSIINYDDYVIPNYTRKILYNFTYNYIEAPDTENDYVKVFFPDFTFKIENNIPLNLIERELCQKIKKYAKINVAVFDDYQDSNNLRKIFTQTKPNKVVDVVIVNFDEYHDYHESYNSIDVYVRDKDCPHLIHNYLCHDDDIYTVVMETNRSITEFMAKFEYSYNSSFFL